MFAQDSTLIGDVDCSGEVNSQDASLILQFVTNVIDELPCEANMTGLTPEQLQEIIDMMSGQLNVNYTGAFPIEGWIEHDYQATFCCGGNCSVDSPIWFNQFSDNPYCQDNPIVNVASKSGILSYNQAEAYCYRLTVIVNGIEIINNINNNRYVSFPIKQGDEFIIYDECNANSDGVSSNYINQSIHFFSFGDEEGSSGNSNSNTSGPNQTVGVGSVTDLNDFDKEYDMFNAQFSGGFDNNSYYPIHIHTDQLNNTYIIGSYNSGDNNSIGGISLYSGSGETFFIAKYDSTGVIISVISEPVGLGDTDAYELESSIVDNDGNIFVGGAMKNSAGAYFAFIRKYSTTNLTFVDEEISSTNNTSSVGSSNRVYDIVSDGSGGVYLAGSYEDDMTIGGNYLASDNTSDDQGLVFHWNSSGTVPWANSIGDINESNLNDFASSIIVDQNNDILVAGSLKLNIGGGSQRSKYFIKRYDAEGTLMTTVESTERSNNMYESWGIHINTDNNGNIYLFTTIEIESTDFAFNSFILDPIDGRSQILYKMDINFSVLNAINFGTNEIRANQIITLSNNDVILRSIDMSRYIIDNNVYVQDVNQYGNITHLDSNNSFIKFHTIGNNIGTQDAISITSDANTLYCLYKRTGTFINNGTNHPAGYYVVKENY